MSKSKSRLTGAVSTPVMVMPNTGTPPSFPMAVSTPILPFPSSPEIGAPPSFPMATSIPMLEAALDTRPLTDAERRALTGGRIERDILYIKNAPNMVNVTNNLVPQNRFFLFLEETDASGRPILRLIPYQTAQMDSATHRRLIEDYRNLGYNVSDRITGDMSWAFGRMANVFGQQWIQIKINNLNPFASKFTLVEATWSQRPPFTQSFKVLPFERRMIPNRPMGDLGLDYQRMRTLQRTNNSGELSEGFRVPNLLLVGAGILVGMYAYDKLKSKKKNTR